MFRKDIENYTYDELLESISNIKMDIKKEVENLDFNNLYDLDYLIKRLSDLACEFRRRNQNEK